MVQKKITPAQALKRYRERKRRTEENWLRDDRHYFKLKGSKAEDILNELAERSFLTDWCYANPSLPDGKELCDLLIIFDNTAIIWQIKDVQLKDGQIKESDFRKNISQLSGAYRQLFELKTHILLNNPRRGNELFDSQKIEQIYLIAGFFGESPFFVKTMFKVIEKHVHVFTRRFTETILNELDTISDFTKYLHDKEELHKSANSIIIQGGEEEILGHYILNDKTFNCLNAVKPFTLYVEGGQWKQLQQRSEYKAKKKEDFISYYWDYLINICHTGDNSEYEIIAREMARSNRFERRIFSQQFIEANKLAHSKQAGIAYRRVSPSQKGITYCFLFYGNSVNESERNVRKKMLSIFCYITRGKIQENNKVVGIATDQYFNSKAAFDYCLIDIENWSDEDEELMKKNIKETGIFSGMQQKFQQYTEYPQ
ncbi:MAG: hypothetical protein ABFD79_04735 [Phycisphaerales bacterium]